MLHQSLKRKIICVGAVINCRVTSAIRDYVAFPTGRPLFYAGYMDWISFTSILSINQWNVKICLSCSSFNKLENLI